ncbi:MAG TPA: hypothetical protein VGN78_12605 [Solirubrobacteraceae bacterium]|jgi:hypothetical protein|nr:hypothetical protein [Solirubrobacteraceae bacterium]
MTDPLDDLQELTDRLRDAAARLRDDSLSPDDAAELIEMCARLAAEAGAELDRRSRAAAGDPPSGQGELL